jgi:hypothetical protein
MHRAGSANSADAVAETAAKVYVQRSEFHIPREQATPAGL